MHDLRFANEILDTLHKAFKNKELPQSVSVNVRLSTASHVSPNKLKDIFREMASNTQFKDVRLNVIPLEVKINCKNCGEVLKVTDPKVQCAACGSDDIAVSFEREFYIESIEIEGD